MHTRPATSAIRLRVIGVGKADLGQSDQRDVKQTYRKRQSTLPSIALHHVVDASRRHKGAQGDEESSEVLRPCGDSRQLQVGEGNQQQHRNKRHADPSDDSLALVPRVPHYCIYGRSDHFNYALQGVLIAFFFTDLHGDDHQRTDEAEFIDYPHHARITNYIGQVVNEVANGPRPRIIWNAAGAPTESGESVRKASNLITSFDSRLPVYLCSFPLSSS